MMYRVKLSADAAAITYVAQWVAVVSRQLSSRGATTLEVKGMLIGAVSALGGAAMRVLITGGSFTNEELFDPIAMPVLSGNESVQCTTFVDLPETETMTTYTITMQAQATVIAGSVTPKKGTTLIVEERIV